MYLAYLLAMPFPCLILQLFRAVSQNLRFTQGEGLMIAIDWMQYG